MFKRSIAALILSVIAVILAACSGNKLVKTYEGKTLAPESTAVLTAPENITVLAVNGKEVQQYLLSNLEVDYGLAEGENVVAFKYKSIWSKAKKDAETGLRVDVVESLPLEVKINAKAGEKYHFSFVDVQNVREAKEAADQFQAQILDSQLNLIAESVPLNTYKMEKQAEVNGILSTAEKNTQNKAEVSLGESKPEQSVLAQLKQLWPTANADEKKAFLVWVFQ